LAAANSPPKIFEVDNDIESVIKIINEQHTLWSVRNST